MFSSSKAKVNAVSSPAGTDVGDTVWKLVGQLDVPNFGGAGDDLTELVLPQV